MIFDRFFDHFSIIKNRHAGMRIQFLMSDMASGNQNLISGHVTKDIQGMDQKQRIFSIKIGDFSSFFDQKNRHAGMRIQFLMSDMASVKKRLAWGSNPRATSSFRHVNFVREASASSSV